ncbi:K+-transporting ATPase ATPase A chain [Tumebacillus sp. BK434]|uniref:potassium-transporting ATPase subunit KdpA n=1 Tax=Tumebacillus sp. BK434 TaxID=2512169 RepID=UPI001045453B|nr:potassium-transporting ATPase subunit KdpA [Tumebacillus sp. BK434]TCP58150.1 K+-transporting ATPase ATPase A chain [Tumebacillus sp. BK434]
MSGLTLISIAVTVLLAVLFAKPAGLYLAAALDDRSQRLNRFYGPLEKVLFRLGGVQQQAQSWQKYACSMVLVNAVMLLLVYLVFRFQGVLPLNPAGIPSMEPTLAMHTAISFMTNTNLQHYSGETGLSAFSQLIGITFLMFTAPATALAAAFAFIRGLSGRPFGNFYVDLVRSITRVLLPLSLAAALLFVASGVPQMLEASVAAKTLEGAGQTLAVGPVGSFVAIKELGNNGGGYFGVNSAHPFENPNGFTNFLQMLLMLLLPTALPFAYGQMVGNRKQGRVLFVSMLMMFVLLLGVALTSEAAGNPALSALGIDQSHGSMEGKEVRFGTGLSALYAVVTTASETGAVNTMHDTLTPGGGMSALLNMLFNTVFGGVGAGFMNVLLYAMIAVFLSGLMVGRTPEFLGKKLEGKEMKLIAITLLIQPFLILAPTALALATSLGTDAISQPGYHGLTQVLYEYTSSAANNGSGYEGLGDATVFWNLSTGIVMYLGRYVSCIALLAVAASLAAKRTVPETGGTFRTDNMLFAGVWLGTILIVGALTYLPALVLGPIAESLTL